MIWLQDSRVPSPVPPMKKGHQNSELQRLTNPSSVFHLPPGKSPALGAGKGKWRPLLQGQRMRGSQAGIPGYLWHPYFLFPCQYKAESSSILQMQNPHSAHLSTCVSDHHPLDGYTSNQIIASRGSPSLASPRTRRGALLPAGPGVAVLSLADPGGPQPSPKSLARSQP